MNTLIILGIVGIVLLILVVLSKILNVVVGFFCALMGGLAYFLLSTNNSLDSMIIQVKISDDLGISQNDLKTYSLILAGFGIILLIVGFIRKNSPQKVILVQESEQEENSKKLKEELKKELKEELKNELKEEIKKSEGKKEEKS